MGVLTLELGEESDIGCEQCGGTHKSAYGFYFARLRTGQAEPSVGPTLSLGQWWDDDAVDERSWIFLRVWTDDDAYPMGLLDPTLSHHRNYKALANPLDREAALQSPLRDDFFKNC